MSSVVEQNWVDWIPTAGAFGEWFLDSLSWTDEVIGLDTEKVLCIRLVRANQTLSFKTLPTFFRVWDEHSVASEPGYRSYQRHSLFKIKNSFLISDFLDNKFALIHKRDFLAERTIRHYRVICMNEVLDILTVADPYGVVLRIEGKEFKNEQTI